MSYQDGQCVARPARPPCPTNKLEASLTFSFTRGNEGYLCFLCDPTRGRLGVHRPRRRPAVPMCSPRLSVSAVNPILLPRHAQIRLFLRAVAYVDPFHQEHHILRDVSGVIADPLQIARHEDQVYRRRHHAGVALHGSQ
jgi:hypothetical protein